MSRKFKPIDIITLDSEEEEEDVQVEVDEDDAELASAIKLSKEEAKKVKYEDNDKGIGSSSNSNSNNNNKRNSSGLNLEDRKPKLNKTTTIQSLSGLGNTRLELEKARLARVASLELANGGKPILTPHLITPKVNIPKLKTISDLNVEEGEGDNNDNNTSSASGSGYQNSWNSKSKVTTRVNYWTPEIKRVFNRNYPNDGGLTLENLIGPKNGQVGKDHPKMAIVSSYALDLVWVVKHFSEPTSLLIVCPKPAPHTGPNHFATALPNVKNSNLFMLYPEMEGRGAMHVKCCILIYDAYIRIIIPTANFVDFDWETIDNALYVQDFPLINSPNPSIVHPKDNPTHTPMFSLALLHFLHYLKVPNVFLKPFLYYNFNSSEQVKLIVSKPGLWNKNIEGHMRKGGGLIGLAEAVKSFNFQKGGKWTLEATGSSIGALPSLWLSHFLGAIQAMNPVDYFKKAGSSPPILPPLPPASTIWNAPIKIIFPTLNEVDKSINGRPGGGTIFLQKKNWEMKNFPRHLFHSGPSKREGIIAHTKMLVAMNLTNHEGWFYIGSHNFTGAAWGKLQYSPHHGPQLNITNFELGILLPVKAESSKGLDQWFNQICTYKRPLIPYTNKDLPWMQFSYR